MSLSENPSVFSSRKDALSIFQAGVRAADPYQAVKNCLRANDHQVEFLLDLNNKTQKRKGLWSKIHLIAFGKAACAMAKAAKNASKSAKIDFFIEIVFTIDLIRRCEIIIL